MAFSLRDFIYSQDLPRLLAEDESGAFGSPPNLPPPIPFGHSIASPLLSPPKSNVKEKIDDDESSESDEDEAEPKREAKKKRFRTKQAKK